MTENQVVFQEKAKSHPVTEPNTDHSRRRRQIPIPRFWTIVLCIFTLFHIVNFIRVLNIPESITQNLSISIPLEIVMRLIWLVVFIWVTIQFIRQRPSARRVSVALILGFIIYSIARIAVFARADYDTGRIPFLIVGTIIILIIVVVLRSAVARVRE